MFSFFFKELIMQSRDRVGEQPMSRSGVQSEEEASRFCANLIDGKLNRTTISPLIKIHFVPVRNCINNS